MAAPPRWLRDRPRSRVVRGTTSLQVISSCGWMSGGSLLHAATVLSRDARQQRLLTSDIHQLLPVVHWKKVAFCEKADAFLSLAGSKWQKQMEILGHPILKLRSLLFLFIEGIAAAALAHSSYGRKIWHPLQKNRALVKPPRLMATKIKADV